MSHFSVCVIVPDDGVVNNIHAEWSARKSNRLTGLIKKVGYADTQASVENIE